MTGCGSTSSSSLQRYENRKKAYYAKAELASCQIEGNLLGCTVDKDKNICLLLQKEAGCCIYEMDVKGNKKREITLSLPQKYDICSFEKDWNGFYMVGMEDGEIQRYDEEGQLENTLDFQEGSYHIGINERGEIYIGMAKEERLFLYKLMKNQFEQESQLSICGESYFSFATGVKYLSFYDEQYLYQYYTEKGIADPVISWMDEEVAVENIRGVKIAEDGSILLVEQSEDGIAIFEYRLQEKTEERTELVLACVGMDDIVRRQILSFNQENKNYKILVKDYRGEENPYETLNLDIVSGKQFDIMYLEQMPIEEYIQKGILENLESYIHEEDFLGAYMRAITRKDGIYQIAPAFMVYTILGKTDEVGANYGWSYDACENYFEKHMQEEVIGTANKKQLFQILLKLHIEDFIDWNTGIVSFEQEEFIKLLEFVKQYPDKESQDSDYLGRIQRGQLHLVEVPLSSGNTYRLYRYVYGQDITAVGYPNDKEKGNYMDLVMPMGISHSSQYKEAAWEFISGFMTEDMQYAYQDYGFPIRKDVWESLCKEWMNPQEEMTVFLSGKDCVVPPLDEKGKEMLEDWIESADVLLQENEELLKIVEEETQAFLDGKIDAKTAASYIQNRSTIYVNEKK